MDFESSVRYANTYNLSRITAMKAIEKQIYYYNILEIMECFSLVLYISTMAQLFVPKVIDM